MKIQAATAFLLATLCAPGLRAAEGEAGLPETAEREGRGSAGYFDSRNWTVFEFDTEVARQVEQFYVRLRDQYGYAPPAEPLDAFQQGAPALTLDALKMALQSSRAASAEIVHLADSLASLLERREEGRLPGDLRGAFERDSERMGVLARQIENDEYLPLLDRGRQTVRTIFPSGSSPKTPGLALAELRRLAEGLERDLAANWAEDRTQVVSVAELSRPSARSLSRRIRQLADSLRSASPKL